MRLTLRQKFGGHISGGSYMEYSGHLVPNMELVSARCHIAVASLWFLLLPSGSVLLTQRNTLVCIFSAGQSNRSRQER